MTVHAGPAIHFDDLGPESSEDRVSFRVISTYMVGTDEMVMSVTIKRGAELFSDAMHVSTAQPTPSAMMSDPSQPLVMPRKGVEYVAGGLVNRLKLIETLKGLIEALQ